MRPIGTHITLARRDQGLTQAALARKARIPQANLSNIERGKQDITLTTLRRLAVALELDLHIALQPKQKVSPQFSRDHIESLAKDIVFEKTPDDSGDKEIVESFRQILPSGAKRRSAKRVQSAWIRLKTRLGELGIQTLKERVEDAQSRKRGVA